MARPTLQGEWEVYGGDGWVDVGSDTHRVGSGTGRTANTATQPIKRTSAVAFSFGLSAAVSLHLLQTGVECEKSAVQM